MGAAHSIGPSDSDQLQFSIRKLSALWKEKRVEEYCREARLLLSQCRDLIRRKATTTPFRWEWIKYLHALVVVHHRLGESSEEIVGADEDLLIDVYRRYVPTSGERPDFAFTKHTGTSDIHKRRAFAQARNDRLGEAAEQMEEAVRAAQQAIMPATQIGKAYGATKHLRYLEYYAAILRMLEAEKSREFAQAQAALQRARAATEDPKAPVKLFPDYIWDRIDLDTYKHLIEAQRFLFEANFRGALSQYDSWLSANQSHKGRFRYKNVEVRRELAAVLKCLVSCCTGCDKCRAARDRLQYFAQHPFIGDAGRHLAATGAALHQAGSVAVQDVTAAIERLRPYLPILAYRWEARSAVTESDFESLPSYFTSLPKLSYTRFSSPENGSRLAATAGPQPARIWLAGVLEPAVYSGTPQRGPEG